MKSPVFVTGYGIISSIGNNAEENFHALQNNKHGFGRIEFLETVHRDTIRACEIKKTDQQLHQMAGVAEGESYTRVSTLGAIAATEAIQLAGLSEKELQKA